MSSRHNPQARLQQLVAQLPKQHVDFSSAGEDDSISLTGHSCVVTGGCSGLGRAFVEALAMGGAWVAAWDLDVQNGQALERELCDRGLLVKFFHSDVSDWHSQVTALQASIDASPNGRVDHFVANAGVAGHMLSQHIVIKKPAPSLLDAPVFSALNVSLIGSYYTLCLACHHFTSSTTLKAGSDFPAARRSITLVGSMSSYRSMPHGTDYAAAKFGIRGLFTSARETMPLYRLDVRVNMLAPQFIETAMNTKARRIHEKAGYLFGDIKHAVSAMIRVVGDTSISGRSIATNIEGPHDMDDDVSGCDGSTQTQRLLHESLLPAHYY